MTERRGPRQVVKGFSEEQVQHLLITLQRRVADLEGAPADDGGGGDAGLTGLNQEQVDARVAQGVGAHRAITGAHHARYTDLEADARVTVGIGAHRAMAGAHHARYTNAEARAQANAALALHTVAADPHPAYATDALLAALAARVTALENAPTPTGASSVTQYLPPFPFAVHSLGDEVLNDGDALPDRFCVYDDLTINGTVRTQDSGGLLIVRGRLDVRAGRRLTAEGRGGILQSNPSSSGVEANVAGQPTRLDASPGGLMALIDLLWPLGWLNQDGDPIGGSAATNVFRRSQANYTPGKPFIGAGTGSNVYQRIRERGGGVLVVIADTLNNLGTIDADGASGQAPGGGGVLAVAAVTVENAGTQRANAGALTAGQGSGDYRAAVNGTALFVPLTHAVRAPEETA